MTDYDEFLSNSDIWENELALLKMAKTLKQNGYKIGRMSIENFVNKNISFFERSERGFEE